MILHHKLYRQIFKIQSVSTISLCVFIIILGLIFKISVVLITCILSILIITQIIIFKKLYHYLVELWVSPLQKLVENIPALVRGEDFYTVPIHSESWETTSLTHHFLKIVSQMKILINQNYESQIQQERQNTLIQTLQMLAHDIRQPIKLMQLALNTLQKTPTYQKEECLNLIQNEFEKTSLSLNSLLQDMNSLHSLEEINLQWVSWNYFLRDVAEKSYQLWPEIDLIWEERSQTKILVDKLKMQRVFWNLITNAVEAMNSQSNQKFKSYTPKSIWIVTSYGDSSVIRVGNTQSVIEYSLQKKIFDPFVSRASDKRTLGIGLGLAVVKKIIEEHGASIETVIDPYPFDGVEFKIKWENTAMSDEVLHITEKNFKSEVLESPLPVLVDFWAPWCGPCLALAPTLEEIALEKLGKIKICKVNVEDEPALAAQFNIRNIPFLAIFKNGQKVQELVGNQPKSSLEKAINAHI